MNDILDRCEAYQKARIQEILEICKHEQAEATVLFGDSLFQSYPMEKLSLVKNLLNFGVNGATTQTLYLLLQPLISLKPRHVVFLIGTNDFDDGHEFDLLDVTFAVFNMILMLNQNLPKTKISVISPLPIDEATQKTRVRSNMQLKNLGKEYRNFEKELSNVTYIDVFSSLVDENQQLKAEYTIDGLHLSDAGYEALTKKIENYLILL